MHRAEVGHRFRRQSSIRRLKSWLKATRPTMRWRPSPAFSTAPETRREPEKPRSRSKGPWPLRPSPCPPPIEAHGYSRHRSRTDGRDPFQMDGAPRQWRLLCRRDHRREFQLRSSPARCRPGSRDPDGRLSRKRRTPALRAIEERDEPDAAPPPIWCAKTQRRNGDSPERSGCSAGHYLGGPRKSFLAISTPAWRRMS